MATYVFEAKDGTRIEREFKMGQFPKSIRVKGKLYQKIIWTPQVRIPRSMMASYDDDRAIAEYEFHQPNPMNKDGMSDKEMVQKGYATTKDMKKWE